LVYYRGLVGRSGRLFSYKIINKSISALTHQVQGIPA